MEAISYLELSLSVATLLIVLVVCYMCIQLYHISKPLYIGNGKVV